MNDRRRKREKPFTFELPSFLTTSSDTTVSEVPRAKRTNGTRFFPYTVNTFRRQSSTYPEEVSATQRSTEPVTTSPTKIATETVRTTVRPSSLDPVLTTLRRYSEQTSTSTEQTSTTTERSSTPYIITEVCTNNNFPGSENRDTYIYDY